MVGKVQYAPVGVDALDTEKWKGVESDMVLGADTQIRTGLRSRCTLMFGEKPDQTVISVRRATLACIADLFRSQNEQRVRIGLGYGAVRGGSTEGRLRSDVVIDSPVATLAKRGTEGFEMEVAPVGGYFRVSLARSGLVTALSKTQDLRRSVRPGEYVSQNTIAKTWVNQESFDRTVRFFEVGAMTNADTKFTTHAATGMGSVAPGGGRELGNFADREQIDAALMELPPNAMPMVLMTPEAPERPEGNFGFGFASRVRVHAPIRDTRRMNRAVRSSRATLSNRPARRSRGIRR